MRNVLIKTMAVMAGFVLAVKSEAQRVNTPIVVPLHFTQISTGTYKLGIYVGIGHGATPTLFEFDTGATGFYATYSPNTGVSPWWGSGVTSSQTPVNISYASGLHYTGYLAAAPVTLFASSNPSSALITTLTAKIGQMDSIVEIDPSNGNKTDIWNANGSVSGDPPVNGAFYGDFGMGLTYNSNGITNLAAQLYYGRGVTPGFRIHANPLTQKAFVQIGLTRRDIANHSALYLPMNVDDHAPDGARRSGTGFNYFSQQIFDATVHITDHKNNRSLKSPGVGMVTDTGATTTLHNTQQSPEPLPAKYEAFITWDNQAKDAGKLNDGLTFELSARTTSGRKARFFKFRTTSVVDAGNVNVSNNLPDSSNYFMNTGISLFYFYDMIYNLEDGKIGLLDVPRHRKGDRWKNKAGRFQ